MTAGMAASRPSAVANRASAMPGATTARLVFLDAAIAWKLVMMPHTVPNRPMHGAVEPTVARSSPIMTILTTGWAVMKSSKNEKPPVVAGLIMSMGFIA